jgi:hypothetical protein
MDARTWVHTPAVGAFAHRRPLPSAAAAAILMSTKALHAAGSAPAPVNCESVGPGIPSSIASRLQWRDASGICRHAHYAGRRGREAEGGGLLNRYRVVKLYRGFESLRLRQRFVRRPPYHVSSRGRVIKLNVEKPRLLLGGANIGPRTLVEIYLAGR